MRTHRGWLSALTLAIAIAGCAPTSSGTETTALDEPSAALTSVPPAESTETFPTEVFAALGDEPVSDDLAAELQAVLDTSADGHGLTAAVISPHGTWSGATGLAAGDRAMVPNDQMSIANITVTLVAAQVMLLVEASELGLEDLAADRLPPDLEFDTNGATIADLLSMRSGYPDVAEKVWERSDIHHLQTWTTGEVLGSVGTERGPVGQNWEYVGTNYLLLGLIIEQVTGRPIAEVLRSGVLEGDGYERLIYQPDERPTNPMAMPSGGPANRFDDYGGYLPSLAAVTVGATEDAMASDAPSLARWFKALCAGQVVTPASLEEMTDFDERPEYGLGVMDRRFEYGGDSGAFGHVGSAFLGYTTVGLCFQDPGIVVVVLTNAHEHDVDTVAGDLWRAASAG